MESFFSKKELHEICFSVDSVSFSRAALLYISSKRPCQTFTSSIIKLLEKMQYDQVMMKVMLLAFLYRRNNLSNKIIASLEGCIYRI